MIELLLCSMVTVLPDFLFRRYVQGKRLGHEITFFSVWYELRWGITACAMLTITLVTVVLYYHPSTNNVASYFRTVTVLPETGGRVAEVYVENNQTVEAGQRLFALDDSKQRSALATAQSQVAEVEAAIRVSGSQVAAAEAMVAQAQAAYDLVRTDYERSKELLDRQSAAARESEVERQENLMHVREGELDAARANLQSVQENVSVLLPSQKASAEAALAQAQVELDKTVVVAGVTGQLEQFVLQEGDIVNPLLRPAGILVPKDSGRLRFQAGFSQLSAQVIHTGMIAEIGCLSDPFAVIPMVIVGVQDVIPSGQIRPTDLLRDPQDNMRPGSVIAFMEPLYPGGTRSLPPGSTCMANAYSDFHEELETQEMGTGKRVFLHVVDTVGLIHALVLRLKMLALPVNALVFSGEH